MCVILHAKKKKHLRKDELLQAMKANSAGFFMAAIHPSDHSRTIIRTLDDKELLKFFDKVNEDDEIVCHCRIPSRGEKNLENVHGWEEDGILFSHNMTISSIDAMMTRVKWDGTDSEFFFRRIFIPYYRGLGDEAYKDGKLHEDLDNLVQFFAGTMNKFCFIMPDGNVLRYGTWVNEPDRKEGDDIAFWASNTTYKVYTPAWSSQKGGGSATVPGFRRNGYFGYDDDYDYVYDEDRHGYYPAAAAGAKGASKWTPSPQTSPEHLGKMLRNSLGDVCLLQIAMCHMAAAGYSEYRAALQREDLPADHDLEQDILEFMTCGLPRFMDDASLDVLFTSLQDVADARTKPEIDDAVGKLVENYAEAISEKFFAYGNHATVAPMWPTVIHIQEGKASFIREYGAWKASVGLTLDWDADAAEDFAVAFDHRKTRAGNWTAERIGAADLLGSPTMTDDDVLLGADRLLDRIRPALKAEDRK